MPVADVDVVEFGYVAVLDGRCQPKAHQGARKIESQQFNHHVDVFNFPLVAERP